MPPFGEYAAKTLGYKKIVTIGLDYAFGWETVGGFHKSFEDNGGPGIPEIWVPLHAPDSPPPLGPVKGHTYPGFVAAPGPLGGCFFPAVPATGVTGRSPLRPH